MKDYLPIIFCFMLVFGLVKRAAATELNLGENLFPEGDMESVNTVPGENPQLPAVPAEGAPPGWSCSPGDALQVVTDAHSGKFALKLSSKKGEPVWANYFLPSSIYDGVITFYYKISSPQKKGNLIFYAISWKNAEVDPRASVSCPVEEAGDGKWHKATLQFNFKNPHNAIVLAPRIATEGADAIPAEWIIDDIEVRELGPMLKISKVLCNRVIALPGDSVDITIEFTNDGGGVLKNVQASIAGGEATGLKTFKFEEIKSKEVQAASWRVVAKKPGLVIFYARVFADGQRMVQTEVPIPVLESYPDISRIYTIPAGISITENYACFSNSCLKLYFPKLKDGYAPGLLYVKRDGWGLAGTTGFLHQVIVETKGGSERVSAFSQNAKKITVDGRDCLVLEVVSQDKNGNKWHFDYRIVPAEKEKVNLISSAYAERDAGVFHFRGPWLVLGEGSYGAKRNMVLFSGVEYLTPEESSSNYLYHAPPDDLKYAPPAYMPTVPLFAVETPLGLISLLWTQMQEWTQGEFYPRQYFASPNRFENQDNTSMGLFAINPVDKNKPNVLVSCQPYKLKGKQALKLEATLWIKSDGNIYDAVDEWIAQFGLPPMPRTKTFEEELKWMGESTEIVWPNLRAEISSLSAAAKKSLKSQNPDGSWDYKPHPNAVKWYKDPNNKKIIEAKAKLVGNPDAFSFEWYGKPGDKASGVSAWELLNVLKAGLYMGDTEYLEAGLKGLEYVRKNFKRPEGAQVWEIPLHAPDILPAGMLPECFILAYRATGDKSYLDDAVFWARTGISFVYLWNAHDRDVMAYATIPIYGSSFYLGTWNGVPVQWCGMWYARGILYLSRYDNSRPWREIGEGITRCCMQQQVYYGDPKKSRWFCYPDVWNVTANWYGGADISPGDITRNIRIMRGNPEISTRLVSYKGKKVFLSSEGEILNAEPTDRGVRIVLGEGPPTNHVVIGKTVTVKEISINDSPAALVSNYTDEGWRKTGTSGTFVNTKPKSILDVIFEE